METPPTPPEPERPRLGWPFTWTLMAPLVLMALVFSVVRDDKNEMAFWIPGLAMLGCSIACAVMVGRASRQATGLKILLGFLTFFGLQVLYITCFVTGCTMAMGAPNFH